MGYLLAHQGEVLAHLIRQALATRQFIAQDAQGAERCAQAVRGTRRQVTKTDDIGIAGASGARLEQRGLAFCQGGIETHDEPHHRHRRQRETEPHAGEMPVHARRRIGELHRMVEIPQHRIDAHRNRCERPRVTGGQNRGPHRHHRQQQGNGGICHPPAEVKEGGPCQQVDQQLQKRSLPNMEPACNTRHQGQVDSGQDQRHAQQGLSRVRWRQQRKCDQRHHHHGGNGQPAELQQVAALGAQSRDRPIRAHPGPVHTRRLRPHAGVGRGSRRLRSEQAH